MEALITSARVAQRNAYAPYSHYRVGAALRTPVGLVFAGCNVENISLGLTICAERNAIFAMVAAGHTKWTEIAIATQDGGTPCGACLQVLSEFASDPGNARLYCASESGEIQTYTLAELMPHAFSSPNVKQG